MRRLIALFRPAPEHLRHVVDGGTGTPLSGQDINPGPLVPRADWETCVGCHALRDETMGLNQRMRLANRHRSDCAGRFVSVMWK